MSHNKRIRSDHKGQFIYRHHFQNGRQKLTKVYLIDGVPSDEIDHHQVYLDNADFITLLKLETMKKYIDEKCWQIAMMKMEMICLSEVKNSPAHINKSIQESDSKAKIGGEMKKQYSHFGAMLILVTSLALAKDSEEWVQISYTDDSKVFAESNCKIITATDQYGGTSEVLKAWAKISYRRPQKDRTKEMRTEWIIDCNREVLNVAQSITYDRSGKVISRAYDPSPNLTNEESPAPETLSYRLMKHFCTEYQKMKSETSEDGSNASN